MKKLFWILMIVALSACVPKISSTAKGLADKHGVIQTDARRRVITKTQQGMFSTTGVVEPLSITCTEPSPDVATTLANSLGAGVSAQGVGAISLSAQQVEGLVQLGERTAAIQLLRDKMYQTCLSYANGAITGTTYSLIMSRLDDAIVTLSLGDGAAGAFGRKLAGAGGEAAAKSDATLEGLPTQIASIGDLTAKLSAANQKVDEAEKALKEHTATKPGEGKEKEYEARSKELGEKLEQAKAERNTLLELLRSTAKSAGEASGKIPQLQTGGDLKANPAAEVLREMQADFLLKDFNRDFVFTCLVELGLRGGTKDAANMKEVISTLKTTFEGEKSSTNRSDYVGAVLRERGTALAEFCTEKLLEQIKDAAEKNHAYRMYRAQLSANVQDKEIFLQSLMLCVKEFEKDPERKQACLDKLIPTKPASTPPPPAQR